MKIDWVLKSYVVHVQLGFPLRILNRAGRKATEIANMSLVGNSQDRGKWVLREPSISSSLTHTLSLPALHLALVVVSLACFQDLGINTKQSSGRLSEIRETSVWKCQERGWWDGNLSCKFWLAKAEDFPSWRCSPCAQSSLIRTPWFGERWEK